MAQRDQRPGARSPAGQTDDAPSARAEIFTPTSDGRGAGYAFKGHGGVEGADVPTPRADAEPKTVAQAQAKALAETVVGSILDRLTAEAERKGGTLTVSDLKGLDQEFEKKTVALRSVFEKSFDEYMRTRERAIWQSARQDDFDRLLVKRFSHLFADDSEGNPTPGKLSRRMLPGFFMAVTMMLGEDVVREFHESGRQIVDGLRMARGDLFDWNEAYRDGDAVALILEALAGMAPYFEDMERRARWFIELVNSHLPPPEIEAGGEGGESAVAEWRLTDAAFAEFVRALFFDLGEALAGGPTREVLVDRLGPDTCDTLAALLDRIESYTPRADG